jgi:hypothetical protein
MPEIRPVYTNVRLLLFVFSLPFSSPFIILVAVDGRNLPSMSLPTLDSPVFTPAQP